MPIARTLRVMVAVTLAGGLLLAACGDDTEALSKEEFVAQADAICQATSAELEPVFEAAYDDLEGLDEDDPDAQQAMAVRFDEAMGEAEPLMLQQVADIGALAPPQDDGDLIAMLLDDLESAVEEFAATMEAAAGGDEAALAVLDEGSEDPLADVNRRARDYGLAECGSEG